MRRFYEAGNTRSYAFRKEQLLKLKKAVVAHEQDIYAALAADLKKSPEESFVTENGFLLSEIKYAIHHLFEWMQPQKVSTNLMNLPSKSFVLQEPLGVVMIIGPWNYPLQLLFTPLVGAMAAGNCIMLKASEFAPATAAVMKNIIEENQSNVPVKLELFAVQSINLKFCKENERKSKRRFGVVCGCL